MEFNEQVSNDIFAAAGWPNNAAWVEQVVCKHHCKWACKQAISTITQSSDQKCYHGIVLFLTDAMTNPAKVHLADNNAIKPKLAKFLDMILQRTKHIPP
jgi:hypothetical protein